VVAGVVVVGVVVVGVVVVGTGAVVVLVVRGTVAVVGVAAGGEPELAGAPAAWVLPESALPPPPESVASGTTATITAPRRTARPTVTTGLSGWPPRWTPGVPPPESRFFPDIWRRFVPGSVCNGPLSFPLKAWTSVPHSDTVRTT
jgi:hypothetical protein